MDSQGEVRGLVIAARRSLMIIDDALLEGEVDEGLALDLRQRIEGAMDRLQKVRDWLDHRVRGMK